MQNMRFCNSWELDAYESIWILVLFQYQPTGTPGALGTHGALSAAASATVLHLPRLGADKVHVSSQGVCIADILKGSGHGMPVW